MKQEIKMRDDNIIVDAHLFCHIDWIDEICNGKKTSEWLTNSKDT